MRVDDEGSARRTGVSLSDSLPELAQELERLLLADDEPELADQVRELRIVDRCRCGDDFCSTFYTRPKPAGAYGPGHRNVPLIPVNGMVIVDVVDGMIAAVEILYRDEIRPKLQALVP